MKKIHISYGNEPYYGSLNRLKESSLRIGKTDEFIPFTREWLESTGFYQKNRYILDKPRGNGYWLYKMYCILSVMENTEPGDVVMYTDAAMDVISDLSPLYDIASEKGRMLFVLPGGHRNRTWTKRDCFVILGCDEQKYHDAVQTNGAISLWKNTEENIEFITDALRYMRDPRVITDDPNMCGPNYPGFRDHRHDQSVLSLLSIKNGFERFRDPTQYGNATEEQLENSPYPQMFNHHRMKI